MLGDRGQVQGVHLLHGTHGYPLYGEGRRPGERSEDFVCFSPLSSSLPATLSSSPEVR